MVPFYRIHELFCKFEAFFEDRGCGCGVHTYVECYGMCVGRKGVMDVTAMCYRMCEEYLSFSGLKHV